MRSLIWDLSLQLLHSLEIDFTEQNHWLSHHQDSQYLKAEVGRSVDLVFKAWVLYPGLLKIREFSREKTFIGCYLYQDKATVLIDIMLPKILKHYNT